MSKFAELVQAEVRRATSMHGPLANIYEALGVILEELDEFKAEVWKKRPERDLVNMGKELVQIGAMVQRTFMDMNLGSVDLFTATINDSLDKRGKVSSAHHGYMIILRDYSRLQNHIF